jgi:hypothetical protein
MAHIDPDAKCRDLRLIRLENQHLCVEVLPEAGAKIYNFVHKPSGRNLLWHNPHLPPVRLPFGAAYDDNWSGGWDELLPNDLPRPTPDGDLLPDHGEVWSQEAEWEVLEDRPQRCAARFTTYGRVLPTRFEKVLSLQEDDSFLRIRYTFSNLARHPIDFLWNIHPALAISQHTRLAVPAERGITDPWRETQFQGNTAFTWPNAVDRDGRKVDLRRVDPPGAGIADMHYLVDVRDGWYAATDQAAGVGFALAFPRAIFPHVWLFRALGGWRGLYTLILEASTGYPYDLDVARQRGTCGHLEPGASIEAEVLAIAYSGISDVADVRPDGRVIRKA